MQQRGGALVGGAQNGFLLANTPALQAEFALTPVETSWLTVAFYSTYATMSMLLFRVRQEFGIQPFVRWAMAGLSGVGRNAMLRKVLRRAGGRKGQAGNGSG